VGLPEWLTGPFTNDTAGFRGVVLEFSGCCFPRAGRGSIFRSTFSASVLSSRGRLYFPGSPTPPPPLQLFPPFLPLPPSSGWEQSFPVVFFLLGVGTSLGMCPDFFLFHLRFFILRLQCIFSAFPSQINFFPLPASSVFRMLEFWGNPSDSPPFVSPGILFVDYQ